MQRYTYDTTTWYTKFKVCRMDQLGHKLYLVSYYNGTYTWSRDYLYGREYSEKTALQHVAKLNHYERPDTAWTAPVLHM